MNGRLLLGIGVAGLLAIVQPVSAHHSFAAELDADKPVTLTPRLPPSKVDFSGVWSKPHVPDMTKNGKYQKGYPELPFMPWGEHEWVTYDAPEGDYFSVMHRRPRHVDGIPTWFGDSVGRWEGDTLVIDTVNFNGKMWSNTIGHPHGKQLHLIQRFTRPDARSRLVRGHCRRSQDVRQAVDEHTDVHAAPGLGDDGVLLRQGQQQPLGGNEHGSQVQAST